MIKEKEYMINNQSIKTDYIEIVYKKNQWKLLSMMRERAKSILSELEKFNLNAVVHGSVARGDVNRFSDIDIFIPQLIPSFKIESSLKRAKIEIKKKYMIQATPNSSMKAYLEIDEITTISFPLMNLRRVEREFYRFGGAINLKQINSKHRVLGVDKKLMLIEPTEKGHIEQSILGIEDHVARLLKISTQTILNRVNTLKKRKKFGRTGVFIKEQITSTQTFEMAIQKIARQNPAVRRRLI
jgi:predicted nucleotidyltransferase